MFLLPLHQRGKKKEKERDKKFSDRFKKKKSKSNRLLTEVEPTRFPKQRSNICGGSRSCRPRPHSPARGLSGSAPRALAPVRRRPARAPGSPPPTGAAALAARRRDTGGPSVPAAQSVSTRPAALSPPRSRRALMSHSSDSLLPGPGGVAITCRAAAAPGLSPASRAARLPLFANEFQHLLGSALLPFEGAHPQRLLGLHCSLRTPDRPASSRGRTRGCTLPKLGKPKNFLNIAQFLSLNPR